MLLSKNYLLSTILLFFLAFSVTFKISTITISMMQVFMLFIVLLLIFNLINTKKIDTIFIKYIAIVFAFVLYVELYTYNFTTYQDHLVRNFTILFFLVVVVSLYTSKTYFSKMDEIVLLKMVFYLTVFYSIIVLIMAYSETIRTVVYSIVKIKEGFVEKNFDNRMNAINGISGARFSMLLVFGMISGMMVSKHINKFIYFSSITIIVMASIYVGRTGLFLLILMYPMIYIIKNIKYNVNFLKIFLYLFISFIVLSVLILILYLNLDSLYAINGSFVRFVRMIQPILESGSLLENHTIQLLLSTHYFLPDDTFTLLFGCGSSGRDSVNTGFYLSSDVGYVRNIFAYGIVGSFLLYAIYLTILINSLMNLKNSYILKYTFIATVMLFVFQLKEVGMPSIYLSFLIFIPYFSYIYRQRRVIAN